MKRLLGAHQFQNSIVCDRCGFKTTGLDRISRSAMREHIKAKHEDTPSSTVTTASDPDGYDRNGAYDGFQVTSDAEGGL